MANRTVKYAVDVHGTNPQYLIEKIVRERIYDCKYWQEDCFLLTSALVLERAVDDLKYIGGTYGAKIDPTPFLCLTLKLLQIQPQIEIIYLFIEQSDFKYLRALGAFYLRLIGKPVEIYSKLEPIYNDYRKLRIMDTQRTFNLIHMDEFIDKLLRDEKVLNITLPRLTKRSVLEENRDIKPYKSELEEQNLIPTQIIQEKLERQQDNKKNRMHEDQSDSIYDKRLSDIKGHSSRYDGNKSAHRRDRYRKYEQQSSNTRYHERDGDRSRSTSPNHEPKIPNKYTTGKGRFSQVEIDNENAIRFKLGLKPLH